MITKQNEISSVCDLQNDDTHILRLMDQQQEPGRRLLLNLFIFAPIMHINIESDSCCMDI